MNAVAKEVSSEPQHINPIQGDIVSYERAWQRALEIADWQETRADRLRAALKQMHDLLAGGSPIVSAKRQRMLHITLAALSRVQP